MALGMRSRELAWREPLLRETEAALARLPAALRLLAQHHVVLAGPVNAGKSTLANRLAGADRHIVSAVPGTTRDRLDTPIELHGMSVLLTDTAGLRDAHDAVEREGQRRAREAAGRASVLVFVLDGSQAPSEAVLEFIRHSVAAGAVLPVLNKSDLGLDEDARGLGFLTGREPVALSATTGAGCDTLAEVLERELLGEVAPQPGAPFTRRHERLLTKLREGLQSGTSGSELLGWLRKLIGHRPDAEELAEVMAESER
jgi:tRNA modification GTPase